MTTDTNWTWTILMRNGQVWHFDKPVDIHELLLRYENAGYHHTEIEAIIRH